MGIANAIAVEERYVIPLEHRSQRTDFLPLKMHIHQARIEAGAACLNILSPALEAFGAECVHVLEDRERPFTVVEFRPNWKGHRVSCVAGAWDLRDLMHDMLKMLAESVGETSIKVEQVIFRAITRADVEATLAFLEQEGIRFQGDRVGKGLSLKPVLDV